MQTELKLIFPGALAGIYEIENGYWRWWASHTDGSGKEFDWTPTKRGAMICAVRKARSLSGNYGSDVKWRWENAN